MEKQQIIAKLRELIEANLEVTLPEEIKESDRVFEKLGLDSIMVMQLIVYLEEEFAVEVPIEGLDPSVFETIGGVVELVETLMAKRKN